MVLIIIFVLAGLWLLPAGVGAGPGLAMGTPPQVASLGGSAASLLCAAVPGYFLR